MASRKLVLRSKYAYCDGFTNVFYFKQIQEKPVDSIDELRRVVLGLIESGASKELLELFKDGLMSVASTNYNSTADQLRLENLVTRINNYIA